MQLKWPRTQTSQAWLAAQAVLLSLPFMCVFSINIGFSLKIYEVVIMLSAAYALLTQQFAIFDWRILLKGFVFFAYATAALILNIEILHNRESYDYLARFSPLADGILKCFYVLLCLLGFNLIAYLTSLDPKRAAKFWMYGAAASAAIHLSFTALSALGQSIPRLPGMPEYPSTVQFESFMGMSLFRPGTFMEGNYAGPFFVLSLMVALYARNYRMAALFLVTTLASFSTAAMIGLMAAGGYFIAMNRRNMLTTILIVTSFALFTMTPFFQSIVKGKLTEDSATASSIERSRQYADAKDLFLRHPFFGVGIAQYGLNVEGDTIWRDVDGPDGPSLDVGTSRSIPNSIYMELASEFGIFGCALFVLFLLPIANLARKCPSLWLKCGLIAIPVFWLASPTFTLMYYWAYFGIICGMTRNAIAQGKLAAEFYRSPAFGTVISK